MQYCKSYTIQLLLKNMDNNHTRSCMWAQQVPEHLLKKEIRRAIGFCIKNVGLKLVREWEVSVSEEI